MMGVGNEGVKSEEVEKVGDAEQSEITNCCENLIRTLLTLECMCHKILINAHLEIFIEGFLYFCFDTIRYNWVPMGASQLSQHTVIDSEASDGLSARSLKSLFCSRTDKFQTAVNDDDLLLKIFI
jgi:hypothetical protein